MLDAAISLDAPLRPQLAASQGFLFATGIENSAPTIQGGRVRRDQMAECGHYDRWREDFALVQEIGCDVAALRPAAAHHAARPGLHDWSFADESFAELRRLGICRSSTLPFRRARLDRRFPEPGLPASCSPTTPAPSPRRFPWVQLYTPVNEMFITAVFSAQYGWWNEQRHDDRSYVTAIKNIVRANVLAMREILKVRPDAIFIQSESTEHFHPECPRALAACRAPQRRALPHARPELRPPRRQRDVRVPDGQRHDAGGVPFLPASTACKRHCVMGNDWYVTNEHLMNADGHSRWAGEVFGYDTVTRDYHARYGLPVMHTETNMDEGPRGDEAERGCGSSGPASCACAATACRCSASPGTR